MEDWEPISQEITFYEQHIIWNNAYRLSEERGSAKENRDYKRVG